MSVLFWSSNTVRLLGRGIMLREAVLRLSVISKVKVARSQGSLVWISDLESTLEELDPQVYKKKKKHTLKPNFCFPLKSEESLCVYSTASVLLQRY